MSRLPLLLAAILSTIALPARAADIAGTWQTDKPRYVMTITKAGTGWRGEWFNLGEKDGSLNGNPLDVSLSGDKLTLNPHNTPGTFHGTVSAETLIGDWGSHDPQKLTFHHVAPKDAFPVDPAPHKIRFVTAAPGVKLEVLDFGGNGRPLVFLAGLGKTAHNFDTLALHFTGKHHVYAITRRGYGVSSAPPISDDNYDADRMGDDVLAVIDALHIEKPVVAGHSIAGQELSSIGTRHPEKLAGLVYLDAAYGYAFYDPGNILFASAVAQNIVRRDLKLMRPAPPSRQRALIAEIQATLPGLQKGLEDGAKLLPPKDPPAQPLRLREQIGAAIISNAHPYKTVGTPLLVLAAAPQKCKPDCDSPYAKALAAGTVKQLAFIAAGNPGGRIVRLAHADHFVWESNEADVVREMNTFMDGLPSH